MALTDLTNGFCGGTPVIRQPNCPALQLELRPSSSFILRISFQPVTVEYTGHLGYVTALSKDYDDIAVACDTRK